MAGGQASATAAMAEWHVIESEATSAPPDAGRRASQSDSESGSDAEVTVLIAEDRVFVSKEFSSAKCERAGVMQNSGDCGCTLVGSMQETPRRELL